VRALVEVGFAVALQCQPDAEDELPASVTALPADLTDEGQAEALLARACDEIGPIGVLINAANASERDSWDDVTRATWDMHIETNLRAPFVLIQQFAKALPTGREGIVINLLDQRINPHLVSYTLSKAALWTLTQTMALALAPRIRVNGVAPGPVIRPPVRPLGSRPPARTGPEVDQPGDPEAIARAVLAILALTSMTGQMIVPDGAQKPAD
jgi:NAD(P)-dependent dehydrogenase (short-subunit alcohol dehydrogenase family)